MAKGKCSKCKGTGDVTTYDYTGGISLFSRPKEIKQKCSKCAGTGKVKH